MGGGGSVCINKIILFGGTSSANFGGRYLGDVSCNVGKLEGVHVGFIHQLMGKKSIRQEGKMRVIGRGLRQIACSRRRGHKRFRPTLTGIR